MNNNQNEPENSTIRISLKYGNTISVATGRPEGKDCYDKQLKEIIEQKLNNENQKFIIVIPSKIKLVSGSYLLGMFETIYSYIGMDGIKRRFTFEHEMEIEPMKLLCNEIIRSGCK